MIAFLFTVAYSASFMLTTCIIGIGAYLIYPHLFAWGLFKVNTDKKKKDICQAMYNRYRLSFIGCQELSVQEYIEIRKIEEVILLDCRSEEEQAVSIMKGCIGHKVFQERLEKEGVEKVLKNPNQMVVCYCTIGMRSGIYAKKLHRQYGINAWNLQGSLLSWLHENGEIIHPLTGKPTKEVHVYGKTWDIAPSGYLTRWY